MSDISDLTIQHDSAQGIFYYELKTGVAYLKYAPMPGKVLEYRETFVPEVSRHSGIASRLVRYALDYARDSGYSVVPTCPFVSDFIEKNQEYSAILHPDNNVRTEY